MMQLKELLKGCSPIRDKQGNVVIQTILNMQLVCLTTKPEFSIDAFENPLSVLADTSRGYGNLTIHNTTNKPIIIPPQSAYLTDYPAQDHATAKAVYIAARSRKEVDDSRCVESSQPGAIRADDKVHRKVLPFHLREASFLKANVKGYSGVWADIERFNKSVGVNGGAHIKHYFRTYEKKLNEYIAHFERPQQVIGTIVLIDGEIVAIDKFPSFTYASQIWDVLIRDCYGALAIASEVHKWTGEKWFTKTLQTTDRVASEQDVAYLKRVLDSTKNRMTNHALQRLEECLEYSFEDKPDEKGKVESRLLYHEGYIGQVISQSNFHYLVSIVKKSAFTPDNLRKAKAIGEKARKQSLFSFKW